MSKLKQAIWNLLKDKRVTFTSDPIETIEAIYDHIKPLVPDEKADPDREDTRWIELEILDESKE